MSLHLRDEQEAGDPGRVLTPEREIRREMFKLYHVDYTDLRKYIQDPRRIRPAVVSTSKAFHNNAFRENAIFYEEFHCTPLPLFPQMFFTGSCSVAFWCEIKSPLRGCLSQHRRADWLGHPR
jgi:hypothetical protein